MQFRLLDSLSLPGDPSKPNEDSFSHSSLMACVFDGATPLGESLMPGSSDAQWLAQFGARRLRAHAEADEGPPRDWVRAAAADAEKSFTALRKRAPTETYEVPFASLMTLSLSKKKLRAISFGDCAALIEAPDGALTMIGETLEKRARERDRASRLAGPQGGASASVREQFLPALRVSRNKVNMKGGEWLFAPDPQCADHAKEKSIVPVAGSIILLATDGFLALVSDYGRYSTKALLAAARSRGLAALGKEIREIEDADPKGVLFPRFKKSDDATALLLTIEQAEIAGQRAA